MGTLHTAFKGAVVLGRSFLRIATLILYLFAGAGIASQFSALSATQLLARGAAAMTAKATLETITGQYAGPGVICPQFRLPSGETISLSGAYPELPPGSELVLSGVFKMRSKCMQGREFRVISERD